MLLGVWGLHYGVRCQLGESLVERLAKATNRVEGCV